MKWIKIIGGGLVGCLLLGVAILALLGMRTDANRLQTSIVIGKPAREVWPWLYDAPKLKSWVSWLMDIKGEPGEPSVGRKSVWVMQDQNNNNALMEIQSLVEAVERDRKLAVKLNVEGQFSGNAVYLLTDMGNGQTKLEVDSRYEIYNSFARLFMPLVITSAKTKMLGDLTKLKSLVEAGKP